MNQQAPQAQSGALDGLGKAAGLVLGFVGTVPASQTLHPYFFEYVLQYTDVQYWSWMTLGWKACLFFLIFSLTWAALSALVSTLKKIVLFIAVSLRLRKERKTWQ